MTTKDSATPDKVGVLGEETPATRRVGADRMAAMDALASARNDEIVAETGGEVVPADKKDEKPEPKIEAKVDAKPETKKSEEKPDDQLGKQMQADERVVLEGDLSKYFFKAKVDGADAEIPLTQVTRALQKDFAADRRLEAASRIKKEAEVELEKARSSGDQAEINRAKAKAAEATEGFDQAKEKLKAAGDALFAGDSSALADAILEVVPRRAAESDATAPDTDKIAEAVIVKVEQRAALTKFAADYPEIVANAHLSAMADKEVRELMEHDGKTFAQAVDLAGKNVRESIKDMAKGLGMTETSEKPTGQRSDRQSRKAQIDEPSSARSAQASTKEEQPQTTSDVISQMREARLAGARSRPPT